MRAILLTCDGLTLGYKIFFLHKVCQKERTENTGAGGTSGEFRIENFYIVNAMSILSKAVLLAAGGFAFSVILVVHMSQEADRKRLREGVRRDLERQKKKKDKGVLDMERHD